jgi:hypothetical protein
MAGLVIGPCYLRCGADSVLIAAAPPSEHRDCPRCGRYVLTVAAVDQATRTFADEQWQGLRETVRSETMAGRVSRLTAANVEDLAKAGLGLLRKRGLAVHSL